jgi:tetratricopeptide (TPR) repeat protein
MAPPRFSRAQIRLGAHATLIALSSLSVGAFAQEPGMPPSASSNGGAAGVVGASPQDAQTQLESTFWEADNLFQQGKYPEAASLFTKALELSQRSDVTDTWRQFSPHIAFNVAHSYRQAGNCEAAQMAFAHYRGLVGTLPTEHVAWHDALFVECPGLEREKPGAASGSAVGGSNTPLGSATAEPAKIPTEPSPSGTWLLDVNTKSSSAGDATQTDMSRVVGWSAAGAAVVSLGLAGVFWVSADSQQDLARGKHLWAEAEGYQSAANTRRVVAGVLTGVGVALGGMSVYLLTRSSEVAPASQTAVAALALRSDGTNISVSGEF